MSESVVNEVNRAVLDAFGAHERLVLAVSGGLDSMVLLDAAAQTVPTSRLTVATFDHGTGSAATAAVRLVAATAAGRGIACVEGRATASLETEAALRDARWRFLRGVATERDAIIVTAHTEDDQVETVLMRVMRDSGARGLAALYSSSRVVRPLLGLRRARLETYARARDVVWAEDPTNSSSRYFRNRVRHDLLPALRRVAPQIEHELLALARDAARWRGDVEGFVTMHHAGVAVYGGLDVPSSSLAPYGRDELKVVWPAIAARAGVTLDRRGLERLVSFTLVPRVGGAIQLSGGWQVVRSRDQFQFRASAAESPPMVSLATERRVQWGDWSFYCADVPPGSDPMSAWLPAGAELRVRAWRPGDTMSCHAGRPPRKVKQLLSRAGITGHERTRWPVVLAGDRIVWVPGVRRADAAPARSGRPGLPFLCEYHR